MLNFGSSIPPKGLKWRSNTYFITIVIGMSIFTDLFLYGLIIPVLPFMLKDRVHLPDSHIQGTISNLLAIYAAASLLSSPIAGILADKFSSTRQLPFVLGLLMLVFATVLLALGQSVAILAVARFLQGASGGVVWTIGMAIIIETVGQENLGKTMGTIFSFCSVAALFAPVLGGILYEKAGYQGVFGVGIGLVVVDFILRLLIIEKKVAKLYYEPILIRPDAGEAGHVSEESPLLPGTAKAHNYYQLQQPQNRVAQSFPILCLFRDPGFLTAIWVAFVQAFLLGAFDATIPLVGSEQFGFNSLKAGLLFLPLGGADFFFGPVFGWCVDRYGTRIIAIIGFTALVPSLTLLRLSTDTSLTEIDKGYRIAFYVGLLVANGIGIAIINSLAIVEAGNIVEKYWRANKDIFKQAPYAQLYGISSMIFSAGLTFGPLIAGYLRGKIGYGNMNAVIAGMCALTAIVSGIYMGRDEEDHHDESDFES
ncbi:major facilitator superfamily domain-containing protein [Phaeosphaeriaceae sp. PMI808]|nr:major facilitator superfamily domain-containing protein [Phaeosphaeriaceae sp. PMI808]